MPEPMIERNARLLCKADGLMDPDRHVDRPTDEGTLAGCLGWELYRERAEKLAAAGLTLAPIDPDDATVEQMARVAGETLVFDQNMEPFTALSLLAAGLDDEDSAPVGMREIVRAAWRAGIGEQR